MLRSAVFWLVGLGMLAVVLVAGLVVVGAVTGSPVVFFGTLAVFVGVVVVMGWAEPLVARVRRLWELSGTRR